MSNMEYGVARQCLPIIVDLLDISLPVYCVSQHLCILHSISGRLWCNIDCIYELYVSQIFKQFLQLQSNKAQILLQSSIMEVIYHLSFIMEVIYCSIEFRFVIQFPLFSKNTFFHFLLWRSRHRQKSSTFPTISSHLPPSIFPDTSLSISPSLQFYPSPFFSFWASKFCFFDAATSPSFQKFKITHCITQLDQKFWV